MWAGPAVATSRSEIRAFMAQLRKCTVMLGWRWTAVTASAPGSLRCNIGAPYSASVGGGGADACASGNGRVPGPAMRARCHPVCAWFPTSTVALIRDIPGPPARCLPCAFACVAEAISRLAGGADDSRTIDRGAAHCVRTVSATILWRRLVRPIAATILPPHRTGSVAPRGRELVTSAHFCLW
jgi:hypothetical protein